jgi:TonB family protein
MTDQPSVTLQLDALYLVPGTILEVRPAIYVTCREQKLNVYIATGAVLDGDTYDQTSVRIRWSSGAPEEASWSRSTDYSAAFAPDPWAFLEHLLGAPDMRFEFQPFDAAPRVATFDARGLDRHIPALETACPRQTDSLTVQDSGAGTVPGPDPVLSPDVVQERPELLSAPQLAYPELLKQAGVEGTVTVQAIIDTMGRVEPNSVTVLQSPNPGFDQAAKNYVLKALFRPGRVYGRAVRVLTRVPVSFKRNAR